MDIHKGEKMRKFQLFFILIILVACSSPTKRTIASDQSKNIISTKTPQNNIISGNVYKQLLHDGKYCINGNRNPEIHGMFNCIRWLEISDEQQASIMFTDIPETGSYLIINNMLTLEIKDNDNVEKYSFKILSDKNLQNTMDGSIWYLEKQLTQQ